MKKRKFTPNECSKILSILKNTINPKYQRYSPNKRKTSQRSYIPVYNTMGTARKVYNEFGKISYR